MKIIIVGNVGVRQRDRVYDRNGISPCIGGVSCEGGYNNQPKIIEYGNEEDRWYQNEEAD